MLQNDIVWVGRIFEVDVFFSEKKLGVKFEGIFLKRNKFSFFCVYIVNYSDMVYKQELHLSSVWDLSFCLETWADDDVFPIPCWYFEIHSFLQDTSR